MALSIFKKIDLVFESNLAKHRKKTNVNGLPGCGTANGLSLEDCFYIWEEAKSNNKIKKLCHSFEESAKMMLQQLQQDTLSKQDKTTILNFLCQSGAVSINIISARNGNIVSNGNHDDMMNDEEFDLSQDANQLSMSLPPEGGIHRNEFSDHNGRPDCEKSVDDTAPRENNYIRTFTHGIIPKRTIVNNVKSKQMRGQNGARYDSESNASFEKQRRQNTSSSDGFEYESSASFGKQRRQHTSNSDGFEYESSANYDDQGRSRVIDMSNHVTNEYSSSNLDTNRKVSCKDESRLKARVQSCRYDNNKNTDTFQEADHGETTASETLLKDKESEYSKNPIIVKTESDDLNCCVFVASSGSLSHDENTAQLSECNSRDVRNESSPNTEDSHSVTVQDEHQNIVESAHDVDAMALQNDRIQIANDSYFEAGQHSDTLLLENASHHRDLQCTTVVNNISETAASSEIPEKITFMNFSSESATNLNVFGYQQVLQSNNEEFQTVNSNGVPYRKNVGIHDMFQSNIRPTKKKPRNQDSAMKMPTSPNHSMRVSAPQILSPERINAAVMNSAIVGYSNARGSNDLDENATIRNSVVNVSPQDNVNHALGFPFNTGVSASYEKRHLTGNLPNTQTQTRHPVHKHKGVMLAHSRPSTLWGQRSQTQEKRYQCEQCGNRFTQKFSLKVHRRIHTGEKPYQCELCGKRLQNKYSLRCHMRLHTGEKPFACKDCDKTFSDRSNYNSHVKTHMILQPYQCFQCGAGFRRKKCLNDHVMLKHGNATSS